MYIDQAKFKNILDRYRISQKRLSEMVGIDYSVFKQKLLPGYNKEFTEKELLDIGRAIIQLRSELLDVLI